MRRKDAGEFGGRGGGRWSLRECRVHPGGAVRNVVMVIGPATAIKVARPPFGKCFVQGGRRRHGDGVRGGHDGVQGGEGQRERGEEGGSKVGAGEGSAKRVLAEWSRRELGRVYAPLFFLSDRNAGCEGCGYL